MQRIIQINIAGRVIPIEEDAYAMLKEYLSSLERQFSGDEGKEIIEDIEYRIAELFQIKLDSGAPSVVLADVKKVIETLGNAHDLGGATAGSGQKKENSGSSGQYYRPLYSDRRQRLLRDPYDKVIGGVCSGISHYFDIDPVIIRLVMAVLFLTAGIGLVAYLIAWAVIPAARTREELYTGSPMTFHDISRNMEAELEDLKRRGEQMSRDLKDFFAKRK